MQIGEAKVSALLVAGLAGVGLTLVLREALRDLAMAISISVPVTLALGLGMFLMASDEIKKKGDDKRPPRQANKGE
jgi:hypothetical protein